MNYTSMPSLQHIALVKTAVTLWNQYDVRNLLRKFCFSLSSCEWQDIEVIVKKKVARLPQPRTLKEKILGLIKPIGLQILKWMEYHDNYYLGIHLPNELYWTPQGTVDEKKTAEALIEDENLDIIKRYKLACIYCLDSEIPELWNKIPENRRKSMFSANQKSIRQLELMTLWTINEREAKLNNIIEGASFNEYAIFQAALYRNKPAIEYVLQNLPPTESKQNLLRFAIFIAIRHCPDDWRVIFPVLHLSDVLCFLLSQMNEGQQMEVFKIHPREVLECLLVWPFQRFFTETVNRMWDLLSKSDLLFVINLIVVKIIHFDDYDYRKLLSEIIQGRTSTFKKYMIHDHDFSESLLRILFTTGKENLKLILKNATLAEKEKIIFSYAGFATCKNLALKLEWNSLKFFIQLCISSQDVMAKFKKEIEEHISYYLSKEDLEVNDMWSKCFTSRDESVQKEEYRC